MTSAEPDPGAAAAGARSGGIEVGLIRSGIHTLSVAVASVGIGLTASVIVARALGPEGKGAYDLMLATAALLVIVLGLSLESGITFSVARTQSVPVRLIAILGAIAACQALVASAAVAVAQLTPFAAAFTPGSVGAAAAVPTGVLVGGALMAAYLRSMLMARGRIRAANWRDLVSRVIGLGAVVIGVVAATGGAIESMETPLLLLWLAATVAVVSALVFLAAVRPDVDSAGRMELASTMRFAGPAYLANLAQFLNYRLDLFLVAFFLEDGQIGLYATAVMFGQLIWLGANSVAATLLPRVAQEDPEGHPHAPGAARLSRMVLGASAAAALFVGLASPLVVPLLLGPGFAASVVPLVLLLPGIVAFAPVKVLAAYLAGAGLPRLFFRVSTSSLVVTVVLDLLLIPRLGIAGAALASSASYTTAAAVMLWIFRSTTGVPLRDVLLPTREDIRLGVHAITGRVSGSR